MVAEYLSLFEGVFSSQKTWLCPLTYLFILLLTFSLPLLSDMCSTLFLWVGELLLVSLLLHELFYWIPVFWVSSAKIFTSMQKEHKMPLFWLVIFVSSLCKWRKWKMSKSYKIRIFNRDYFICVMIHVFLKCRQCLASIYSFPRFVKVFLSLIYFCFWACQW